MVCHVRVHYRRRGDRGRHGRPRPRRRLPLGRHSVRSRPARRPSGRDRRLLRAVRRRHRATVRLRPRGDRLAGHRRRAGHRRGQRGCRQPSASRGGRGPARRRQTCHVREAAGADGRGCAGDDRRGPGHRPDRGRGLHVPTLARHCRRGRTRRIRRDGRARALRRPLLVRLRLRPSGADELALPGPARFRRAGRHRQPPHRHRRVPVWTGFLRPGHGHGHLRHRTGLAGRRRRSGTRRRN